VSTPDLQKKKQSGDPFVGPAVTVMGLTVLILSGLCSGFFSWSAVDQLIAGKTVDPDASLGLYLSMLFGGPIILTGLVVTYLGIRQWRRAVAQEHDGP
jgi:hypothetical protein